MLVGVNTLALKPGQSGGEERFLRKVLSTMRTVQPAARFVLFTDVGNHDSFEGWERVRVEGPRRFRLLADANGRLDGPIKEAGVDLLFSPLGSAPSKAAVPVVVFALDLYRCEEEYVKRRRNAAARLKILKRTCAAAASIVAPSEFVRRTYLRLLDIPLNKVVVAPLGVEDVFAEPQAAFIEKPYLLAVGDTHEYKNIPRLREALALLKDEIPHHLVVVGQACEAEPEDWGENVIRIESCPANCLAGLYQHSDAFIQPSLYEGSGVTVLEAMKAGVPVATSRTGGIEEVAGTAPFYFNAESTSSIVAAIRWAIEENKEQRANRTKFGRKIADEYTWERCAWKTLSAFKNVQ